jgi:hypothetical protein
MRGKMLVGHRHVDPKGKSRPDGQKLLGGKAAAKTS